MFDNTEVGIGGRKPSFGSEMLECGTAYTNFTVVGVNAVAVGARLAIAWRAES